MTLQASPIVAASVAKYFADNFQAVQQSGGIAPPATAYVPPPSQAYASWKDANQNKQFFLQKSGDSYKLASYTQSQPTPESAILVDQNVAYGIASAQLSMTDWLMARVAGEMRAAATAQAFGSVLTNAPEADMSTDLSSLDTASLMRLLKLLSTRNAEGLREVKLGTAQDQKSAIARLGLTRETLAAAMDLQAGFASQAAGTQATGMAAAGAATSTAASASGTAQQAAADSQAADLLAADAGALAASTAAASGLADQAAAAEGAGPKEADAAAAARAAADAAAAASVAANQAAAVARERAGSTAADSAQATQAAEQAQADLQATVELNAVIGQTYSALVAQGSSDLAAARLAYTQTPVAQVAKPLVARLVAAAANALDSRLQSAADLALMANPQTATVGPALDYEVSKGSYVIQTATAASREARQAALKADLLAALDDPALRSALADALAETQPAPTDTQGATLDRPSQTALYSQVAGAVLDAVKADAAYLDALASGAVNFQARITQMLGNELISANERDLTPHNA